MIVVSSCVFELTVKVRLATVSSDCERDCEACEDCEDCEDCEQG